MYAPRNRRGIKDQGGREDNEYRCLPAVDDEQQSRFLKASVTKTTLRPANRQAISVNCVFNGPLASLARVPRGQFNLSERACQVSKSRHTPVARGRHARLFSSIGKLISKDNMVIDAITDRPAPDRGRKGIFRLAIASSWQTHRAIRRAIRPDADRRHQAAQSSSRVHCIA
jgi:hypothetical protein